MFEAAKVNNRPGTAGRNQAASLMLFNTALFLYGFLPGTLLAFFTAHKLHGDTSRAVDVAGCLMCLLQCVEVAYFQNSISKVPAW